MSFGIHMAWFLPLVKIDTVRIVFSLHFFRTCQTVRECNYFSRAD